MSPSSISTRFGNIFLLALALLLAACGSKKPVIEKSAALTGAERLEHRAGNAYAKGDLLGAAKDFQAAMHVYQSLAMVDSAAAVELSLARIDSDEGRSKEALARINGVLALASAVSPNTKLLANGRAAALYLQQKDLAAAAVSLTAAEQLCVNTCDAASALLALRANWSLASGDAKAAQTNANGALTKATNEVDKANGLRGLAEAGLALGELSGAASYAEQALHIDQAQGSSLRVIADLNLLATIYGKAGDQGKSASYAALSQAAVQARKQLISR